MNHEHCSNPWVLGVSDCFSLCAPGANQNPDGTSRARPISKP
ncbi:hypothetical protein PDR5_22870 [Pseudomonas sp. DR 5-09]|nr:hypothetical protein PDR5_22870 [Pseudomonas sp. DR 5-09]